MKIRTNYVSNSSSSSFTCYIEKDKINQFKKDFEDYKQKIVHQRKLKRKTIESVKKYLKTKDIKLLETQIDKPIVQCTFKCHLNGVQKIFKNNSEKYEYLIVHNPQDKWIEKFKQTKEYQLLYE